MSWGCVLGVGTCFSGKYAISENGKLTKWRRTWGGMLERCYTTRHASYQGVTVSEDFLDFQEFMLWAEKQIGFREDGWQLDKDLLVKTNKVYSTETCVFLPKVLNTLLVTRGSVRSQAGIGVHQRSDRNGVYVAQINYKGKTKRLGQSCDKVEAFILYKNGKESYMKELAEEYKTRIDPRAYKALITYEVESHD